MPSKQTPEPAGGSRLVVLAIAAVVLFVLGMIVATFSRRARAWCSSHWEQLSGLGSGRGLRATNSQGDLTTEYLLGTLARPWTSVLFAYPWSGDIETVVKCLAVSLF